MLKRGTKKSHEFVELTLSHIQVNGSWASVVSNLHYTYSVGANVHKMCYETSIYTHSAR